MRVLLVQMPFFTLDTASISLSLIKAALDRAGIECEIRYLNVAFGERLGAELYTWIAGNSPPYLLFGDLVFAESLHGTAVSEEALRALAEPLRTPGVPVVPENLYQAFPEIVTAANQFIEDQSREVPWAEYDLIGFNTMFQIAPVLAMAKRIKSLAAAPRLVLGGSYCESEMGEQLCASFPMIDFVCCTEGEELIVDLARHLRGEDVPLRSIPGLAFREGGAVVRGGAPARQAAESDTVPAARLASGPGRSKGSTSRDPAELDRLPIPRYNDWLAQIRASELLDDGELRLPLETSRGCWWGEVQHCTFCGLNGAVMTYRRKSPERALAEVQGLGEYGVRRLHAVDDILDHRYFKTLLPALAEMRHGMQIFYEIKSNVTYEQVRLLADSGIGWVQPGIESLSTPVLKLMKKGVTGLQNVRLLKWGAELGIGLAWNLLYGFPGEDPADFDRMAELIPALSHLQPPYIEVCQVRLHRFSPLFVHGDAEGLCDIVPAPAYSAIFPFEPGVVARLAYYFDHRYVDRRDPNSYIGPLSSAVRGWHQEAGQAVFVSLRRGDTLRLVDTRAVATEQRAVLTGIERDVFTACESGTSEESLVRELGSVQDIVRKMVARRWLVSLDGKLLSLAVPMDGHVPDHAPGPLVEQVIVKRYREQMSALAGAIRPPPPSLNVFRARKQRAAERRTTIG